MLQIVYHSETELDQKQINLLSSSNLKIRIRNKNVVPESVHTGLYYK